MDQPLISRSVYDIINNFVKNRISEVNAVYQYQVDLNNLPDGIVLNEGGNNYEMNHALKFALHNNFLKADDTQKFQLLSYYIKTWGGVYANSDNTVMEYLQSDVNTLIKKRGVRGIASWTKALTVKDPNNYAILDARVSTTINALQILEHIPLEEGKWFPPLPSRNNTVTTFNQHLEAYLGQQTLFINDQIVYKTYLDLIHRIAKEVKTDIQTIEMLLFGFADTLSKKCIELENQPKTSSELNGGNAANMTWVDRVKVPQLSKSCTDSSLITFVRWQTLTEKNTFCFAVDSQQNLHIRRLLGVQNLHFHTDIYYRELLEEVLSYTHINSPVPLDDNVTSFGYDMEINGLSSLVYNCHYEWNHELDTNLAKAVRQLVSIFVGAGIFNYSANQLPAKVYLNNSDFEVCWEMLVDFYLALYKEQLMPSH